MTRPTVYQPALPPHLVKGLHHEAKLRGKPMTRLLAEIVAEALEHTEGMSLARAELAATIPTQAPAPRYRSAA